MAKVMKALRLVGKATGFVSIAALLVMVALTVGDIFLKYFFNVPIIGATEITRMMVITMTPAFVYALLEGRHVRVGVFVDKLGRRGQLVFDTVSFLGSAYMCILISYQGFIETAKKMAQSQVYTMLQIPTWPFYLIFTLSMGIFGVAIIICLIDRFVNPGQYYGPPKTIEAVKKGGEAV